MINIIVTVIIVIICLLVFAFIIEPIYGSSFVRDTVCGILFWIPFGSLFRQLTHGCAIIPA